jgi:alpha-tubulin suppressor-like RCC1 family protein
VVAWGWTGDGICDVPEGLVATEIDAGYRYSLALTPDGEVVKWSSDYYTYIDPPQSLVATKIAAGAFHALAISADGDLVEWGVVGGLPQ